MTLPAKTQKGKHPLGAGASLEWLHDGKMIVFELADVQRETIDAYMDAYTAILQTWPVEQPFLKLLVAQNANIFLTPYIRAKVATTINIAKQRQIYGRMGLALQKNAVLHVIRLFLKTVYDSRKDKIEPQIFFSRETATAWLEEMLYPIEHEN